MVVERSLAVATHGRYIVAAPSRAGSSPLLVGFHGYAESADAQLERLRAIPGAERWIVVSAQGLNRFYHGRSQGVVANWMTRQDRELAIADNVAFVAAVVDAVAREWAVAPALVFAGFSQGVAMAFRAACSSARRISGVIALGGDVPPELDRNALGRIPAALIGRGDRDEWYSSAMCATDAARLRDARVDVCSLAFEAGHEWTSDFSQAAGAFLGRVWS